MTPPLPTLILAKADSKCKVDELKLNHDFLTGAGYDLLVTWLLSLYPNPANKKTEHHTGTVLWALLEDSSLIISGKRDSNPRPPPWQGDVLPLNYFRKLAMPAKGFEPSTL